MIGCCIVLCFLFVLLQARMFPCLPMGDFAVHYPNGTVELRSPTELEFMIDQKNCFEQLYQVQNKELYLLNLKLEECKSSWYEVLKRLFGVF